MRRVLSCVVVLLAVACSSTNRLQVEEATSPTSSAGPSSRSAQPKAGAKGAPRASTPTGEGPTASTERAPVATRVPGTAITIPRTGRGWDAKNVYVGVTTNQDIQGFADALGVDSLDSGDQRKDAEAMIADINARGGVFGRKVHGIYLDIKSANSRESSGQAACAHFTEDHQVVAVVSGALQNDTEAFRTCMAKHEVPVIAMGAQPFDDRVFTATKGFYHHLFPMWNRLAPVLVDRLVAQKYFTKWDATSGRPGSAPVKVGLLAVDSPIGHRVAALVDRELARVGHKATTTFYYTDVSTLDAAVLRFRSDGITHVISTDQFLFVFATGADSQAYRPRYGITTANAPYVLLQTSVPARQLVGSVGVGALPALDVDAQRDPGKAVPGASRCRSILAKAGLSYGNKRFATAYGYGFCDAFDLLANAFAKRGLAGAQVRDGLATTGTTLRPASTFRSGLDASNRFIPGAVADLRWDASRSCFRYASLRLHAL